MLTNTQEKSQKPQIYVKPGFVWDAQNAYLFDIDGTLLRTRDRIHVDSFTSSVQRVTGFEVSLSGIMLHGSTDTAILREAWQQAGIAPDLLQTHTAAILEAMCATVEEKRHAMDIIRMPGVEEVLHHLAQRGALLGVATGNLELIGWIKIEQAGLREWFRFGGFSDHFPVRSELVRHAAEKARELAGAAISVCVVGDTPRDIEAAQANNLPIIAVATGRYTVDELLEFNPDVCATSLADLLAQARTDA